MVPLPSQPQAVSLEAAVDLTKKSDHWREDAVMEEPEDGSDSDTPLDMSVTASRLTPVFPGFPRPDRDVSPARSDRSDFMVRLPGLYSPNSGHGGRERSTDRSDLDKGKSGSQSQYDI